MNRRHLYGIAPLVGLAVILALFVFVNPLAGFREGVPPVEELTVTRTQLLTNPSRIVLDLTNGGPDPTNVAQVMVDGAYWPFESTRSELGRFDTAQVTLEYPWVDGEAHAIALISSNGVAFEHEIAVAVATPGTDMGTLTTLALIGLYLGLVPVVLGLAWLPWVRRLERKWIDFVLALTVGLLVFLAIDSLEEALSELHAVPGGFGGVGLVVFGVTVAVTVLTAVSARRNVSSPMWIATSIALGIGLHNFGEGLAVGAALALGEVGLSAFLIVGFIVHNTTEGLGIVAPLSKEKVKIGSLLALGALAGAPAALGSVIGGVAFNPTLAVFFLSVGAGAILQVVWQLWKLLSKSENTTWISIGFAVGVAIMWATSLLVTG